MSSSNNMSMTMDEDEEAQLGFILRHPTFVTERLSSSPSVSATDEDRNEPPKTKTCPPNEIEVNGHPKLFYYWLIIVSAIFTAIFTVLIYFQEKLSAIGEQQHFLSYTLTTILGYGYMRMLMHTITLRMLIKWSPIADSMNASVRGDCAFMIIDALSGFLWMPVSIYAAAQVFITLDIELFMYKMGPLAYIFLPAYNLDRILQLMVLFRNDRFIHHFSACSCSLLFLEWWRSGFDLSFFLVGALMDGCAKPLFYWFTVARFVRRHARQTKSLTITTSSEDHMYGAIEHFLLIGSSAENLSSIGTVIFIYYCFHHAVLPAILLILYYILVETILFWKIFTPIVFAVFLIMDIETSKILYSTTRVDYWKKQAHATHEKASSAYG